MDLRFGDQTPHSRPGGEPISVEYTESDGLLGLCLKNFLLTLVTLTIYRFWAKTNVRRHIWSNIKINGQSLEYTGTGMELFLGALIIFAIIGLPFIIISVAAQFLFDNPEVVIVVIQFTFLFGFMLLYGMAVYRARRYRLSRTLWRGIRGTLTGSSFSFSMLYFGSMLLKSMTLGWSTPAMNLNIQQRMFGDMNFGDKSFKFKGPAGPLYARYAICWILTPVIIIAALVLIGLLFGGSMAAFEGYFENLEKGKFDGKAVWIIVAAYAGLFALYVGIAILWTAYTAREMMLFAEYTTFDNARFRFDVTVLSLVGLWLGNLLIMILTLGIGQPYVVQRLMRYMCNRLSVDGTVDVSAIQQSTAAIDKRGEGLVEAFDIDAF
ncbi:MAG: DUF898 domain-containing protein [Rhizobiales bacterium]|nr:DUF898 domain-containing protein [Hyphomicrobiales bacterium]